MYFFWLKRLQPVACLTIYQLTILSRLSLIYAGLSCDTVY